MRIFIICLMVLPMFAMAADTDQTKARLERLERDLNMLQKEYYRNKPGKISVEDVSDDEAKVILQQQQQFQANMELRFTDMEDQLRQFTGKLEEQEHANRKLSEEVRKLSEDMNFRLGALEEGGKGAAKEVKGDGTKQLGTVVIDPAKEDFVNGKAKPKDIGDPKKRYDAAFDLVRQAKYPEAEKAFIGFTQDFPDHALTSSAYFWLGETYFVRKEFEPAAVEYLKGYRKAPTGPKAADNLLKLAISLGSVKKQTEACTVFEKLGKEFPNAAAPIKRKAELERTKLKCGR